ncbi:MAG: hypothetical protein K8R41_09605 [Bacteroidales bacterium]|nr:hypothetical protein [Bacteroidales bacterium]
MKIKGYIFATIIFIFSIAICYSQKDSTIKTDTLQLRYGYNWISIPRHNRPTAPDWTIIANVFNQNNFTDGYNYLKLLYLNAEYTPASIYTIEWFQNWVYFPYIFDNKRIFSTRGYKLNLNQPENGNTLIMNGMVEDTNTSIQLYGGKDNWVGYWLYESQWPFDAIPDNVLDELTKIKGQGWCCVKEWHYIEGNLVPYWICAVHEGNVLLDYGDMVILAFNGSDMEILLFQKKN